MNLAILFWFYKEPEICLNRLELLKKYNPDSKIYGLYGGPKDLQTLFKEKLGAHLDDFYTAPSDDSEYKWIHGDLVILEWFESRGKYLEWDSLALVQWDQLVFTNLAKYFSEVKKDAIFLAGFQVLDEYTENHWEWTAPNGIDRANYLQFLAYVQKEYNYTDRPYCCLFVFEIFPRIFFEKYTQVKVKEIGMLEYKIPIYAKIFGLNIVTKEIGVHWWQENPSELPLNALPEEITEELIVKELKKDNGWKIFHPYFKIWPTKK